MKFSTTSLRVRRSKGKGKGIRLLHYNLHVLDHGVDSNEQHTSPRGVGGGGRVRHSLIWPIWVCAAKQGMVFKVLSLKQGIQVRNLVSWTGV